MSAATSLFDASLNRSVKSALAPISAAVIVTVAGVIDSDEVSGVPSVKSAALISGYTGICAVNPGVPVISKTWNRSPAIDLSDAVKIASCKTFVNNADADDVVLLYVAIIFLLWFYKLLV